ncbi:hypothetical protein [Fischerella sp. PCC 9605]|uniref:hypothetical protein n=1 Tax=Fischerella sp. PCC 9605 TaxID=1173024 RepID=UPI0004B6D633|nr:hypothetical protein [Fischerella sp. PCC 9605]
MNRIIFESNAQLNIKGSLIASTAIHLKEGRSTLFNAIATWKGFSSLEVNS